MCTQTFSGEFFISENGSNEIDYNEKNHHVAIIIMIIIVCTIRHEKVHWDVSRKVDSETV